MLRILLFTLLIVAICVLFLGVRVFFVKGGRFPNEHISQSKAMQQRGIHCYTEQDAEERQRPLHRMDDVEREYKGSDNNRIKNIN
jgi:hypothetical protein